MVVFWKLFLLALVPLAVTVVVFLLDRKTSFGKMKYIPKQLVIGLIFALTTIACSEFGVDVGGSVANTRDASVFCAGFVFGGPAGIIAGLIGGLERWFSIYWGGGEYSRIACSVACVLTGLLAAFMRKFVYEKKRPSYFQSLVVSAGMEVFHLGLLFITRYDNVEETLRIIKICAFPMIIVNSLAVMGTIFVVDFIEFKKPVIFKSKEERTITEVIQSRVLIVVVLAFIFTGTFTYFLQGNLTVQYMEDILLTNINDVKKDIDNGIDQTECRHVGDGGNIIVYKDNVLRLGADKEPEGVSIGAVKNLLRDGKEGDIFFETVNGEKYYVSYVYAYDGTAVIGFYPEEDANFDRDLAMYSNGYLQFMVFFVIYILVFFMVKYIFVKKLRKVNEQLSEIAGGNLSEKVDITDTMEFSKLSADINATVDKMKEYIADAEKRMDSELAFAKSIQLSVLPTVTPDFSGREEFDIFATMHTAKEVGGDFYDFFDVDEDRFAILIADVSGKGIPAAMFMMTAKTLIKNLVEEKIPVNEVFGKANNELCENNESDMFVTAWLGIVNKKTGEVEYVNAGHNPPLIGHKGGNFEYLKSKADLVLAGMEGFKYSKQSLQLEKEDIIFLYTDGVTEASNVEENLYGEYRLQSILNEIVKVNAKTTMENICAKVKFNMDSFVGNAPQFDDITMLAYKRK